MTDTEILDYLEKSVRTHPRMPHDVEIGRCCFTLGRRNEKLTFRELLTSAIRQDQARTVNEVATKMEKT